MTHSAVAAGCLWWQDGARSPALNMAIDEWLLASAPARPPVLRCYRWDRLAASIGYFQPFAVAPEGYATVRRPTGGGVVYHDCDVTFSLVVNREHALCRVDRFASYRLVNEAVREALAALGVDAWLAETAVEVADRRHLVCFASPARHDVIAAGGKLCGGAQRRTADGMLVQASLDCRRLPAIARDRLEASLARSLEPLLGPPLTTWAPTAPELTEATALAAAKYATVAWNRRR